jgi:hypothetical protein
VTMIGFNVEDLTRYTMKDRRSIEVTPMMPT